MHKAPNDSPVTDLAGCLRDDFSDCVNKLKDLTEAETQSLITTVMQLNQDIAREVKCRNLPRYYKVVVGDGVFFGVYWRESFNGERWIDLVKSWLTPELKELVANYEQQRVALNIRFCNLVKLRKALLAIA